MKKLTPSHALIFYAPGALIVLALSIVAAWADLEATFYGFPKRAQASFNGLRCPVLMTRGEATLISATLSNPLDKPLSPSVKTTISSPAEFDETFDAFQLAPGESKRLEWTVDSDNIDMKRFIFAKILVYATYPIPDREAACGIFILDLPGNGDTILIVAIALGILLMGGGLFVMNRSKNLRLSEQIVRPVNFLSMALAAVLIVALMGWWIQAVVLLAVVILAVVVIIAFVLTRS
jgi:hypothetical protein